MDESKPIGGDQDLRTSTLVRHRPIQGEGHVDFLGESEGSLPQPQDSLPDAGEAINDFWSMSGSFIYRPHVEPRVKLYSPREDSFPIPLKYIDVSRTTCTNLDVKQEKRIDDYWNIDGSRDLSDPWTGFTQFTLLEEKAPDGYMWSGERLTRKQLTSRSDHLWPELWKSMGRNAKLKEKQKWSEEKFHLENARKLRRIYFIDPEDKERTFFWGTWTSMSVPMTHDKLRFLRRTFLVMEACSWPWTSLSAECWLAKVKPTHTLQTWTGPCWWKLARTRRQRTLNWPLQGDANSLSWP